MLPAIVIAGGIPKEGEPLYPLSQGKPKALLPIAGKPMIQWVLEALESASKIGAIVVVGAPLPASAQVTKVREVIPNQGEMLSNVLQGMRKVLELEPAAHHVVLVSSDIPAITAEMVDWLVDTTMQSDEDVYYTVIDRRVMEAKYPHSRRSYTRLKDIEVCGGDMNVVRATLTVGTNEELWRRILAARKNVLKQAALLGLDTLILLLLRRLTLEQAVRIVASRMKLSGRAIVSPYAEVGMDVDKPHQLEIVEADLLQRQKERKAG
ncbi:MAG: nucleotidyltransferase family protein [Anaerolineales bacterium]|nr:nucleotidyltransferase family protein [Anaerolineales bacterium]MDW8160750.1 nucleotidyltransferase family protein [Anaerolineales bacterium]